MDKKKSDIEIIKSLQQTKDASEIAHKAAEADIEKDLDLTPPPDPTDGFDEGELARFEGED